jgi:hypothetical protein
MCLPKDGDFYDNLGRHEGLPLHTLLNQKLYTDCRGRCPHRPVFSKFAGIHGMMWTSSPTAL